MRLSNAAASACAGDTTNKGLAAYIGSGAVLKFYTGGVNTTPETAPAGTLLASSAVTGSFGTASNGVTATSTVASATAGAGGTAASFMLFQSNGTTPICDGTVGTSAADINFNSVVWNSGDTIAVSSLSITIPPH